MEDLKALRIEIGNRVIEGRRLDEERDKYWDITRELQKEYWLKEHDMQIGDDVLVELERGRIIGMEIIWGDTPVPIVCRFKKNGSLSSLKINVFPSTKIIKLIPVTPSNPNE